MEIDRGPGRGQVKQQPHARSTSPWIVPRTKPRLVMPASAADTRPAPRTDAPTRIAWVGSDDRSCPIISAHLPSFPLFHRLAARQPAVGASGYRSRRPLSRSGPPRRRAGWPEGARRQAIIDRSGPSPNGPQPSPKPKPVNPRLDTLQPYPFEKLRALFKDVKPSSAHAPISFGIGEFKHATPALIRNAVVAALDGRGLVPGHGGLRRAARCDRAGASAATALIPSMRPARCCPSRARARRCSRSRRP